MMVGMICKENGFRPNIHVYTCLIQASLQNCPLGQAIALHTGYSKAVEDAQFTGYLFISRTTVRATLELC